MRFRHGEEINLKASKAHAFCWQPTSPSTALGQAHGYSVWRVYLDGSRTSTAVIATAAVGATLATVSNGGVGQASVPEHTSNVISDLFRDSRKDGLKVVLR